ncbi:hypothetical protein [Sterolibacterium denitrificans]|uniref:hypothetical protein n=1 Tax=Sterolibacterium denitrificans TaxID=157592 RepID=UPI001561D324|nr:hypothetical protein [Sterolibacterium denitrificans]
MTTDPMVMATALAAGMPPTQEALAWLEDGMRRYLRGMPLENALGFDDAGRMRVRNAALVDAAVAIDSGRGLSPWELAGKLEHAIKRYESVVSLMLKRGRMSVDTLSSPDAEIHRAFTSGARRLASQGKLYGLLSNFPKSSGTGSDQQKK